MFINIYIFRCVFISASLKCVTIYLFLLCRFIKGLQVNHAALSEELKQTIGLEPMPKGINYIISTKVHAYSIHRQSYSVSQFIYQFTLNSN